MVQHSIVNTILEERSAKGISLEEATRHCHQCKPDGGAHGRLERVLDLNKDKKLSLVHVYNII